MSRAERIPTWAWEQLALVLLAMNVEYWQTRKLLAAGPVTIRDVLLIMGSFGLVTAAQKVRSMADRQRERNEAAGVANAPMSCAAYVARWSLVSQVLGLFVSAATSPSWAHLLVALCVAGYVPVWRKRIYRRIWPLEPELTVGETAEQATRQALG